MKKNNKKNNRVRHDLNKHKPRKAPDMEKNGSKPTLILRGRFMINQNLNGISVKQINIIPTLSTCSADSIN